MEQLAQHREKAQQLARIQAKESTLDRDFERKLKEIDDIPDSLDSELPVPKRV